MTGDLLQMRIDEHLRSIATIGEASNGGCTRLAFSRDEEQAFVHARAAMKSLGCQIETDAFGNLYGYWAARDAERGSAPVIMLGTHLDTVICGGRYDGVVGFIVALEALRELRDRSLPSVVICLAVFRAEESTRFKRSCLGSSAAFLGLDLDTLGLSYEDEHGRVVTLTEAVAQSTGARMTIGTPTFGAERVDAYFETHIEQARVLERLMSWNQVDRQAFDASPPLLGLVTSIRAPQRTEWEVRGDGPLTTKVFAGCVLIVERVAELADLLTLDAVGTIGHVDGLIEGANKVNAVPGRVTIPLATTTPRFEQDARGLAGRRGCQAVIETASEGARLTVTGATDHSGGAPMGREHRRDALAAAAEILMSAPLEYIASQPAIRFHIDLRSTDTVMRERMMEWIARDIEALVNLARLSRAAGRELSVTKKRESESGIPIPILDEGMRGALRRSADSLNIEIRDLPSGAGHDAMIAARAGIPTAMLFVPSWRGLSHTPEEYSRTVDIAAAVRVQVQAICSYAERLTVRLEGAFS